MACVALRDTLVAGGTSAAMPNKARTGCPEVHKAHTSSHPFSSSSLLARVSTFVPAAIMAPQLSVAQHILIKTLLTEGFKTQLIAPRAVQRIRLERQRSEMATQRRARVGRRNRITLPMQKALRIY